MLYPQQFQTERLLLRATTRDDAAFVLELFNTPQWLQNIGDRKVYTLLEAESYIENRMLAQLARLGYGNYTAIRRSDGSKIGVCGLYDRPGLEGVDLGFAFLPAFQGQGYAYEMASCILHFALHTVQLPVVKAITLPSNHPSRSLLSKLGMQLQGTVRLPQDTEDVLLYSIDRPR